MRRLLSGEKTGGSIYGWMAAGSGIASHRIACQEFSRPPAGRDLGLYASNATPASAHTTSAAGSHRHQLRVNCELG